MVRSHKHHSNKSVISTPMLMSQGQRSADNIIVNQLVEGCVSQSTRHALPCWRARWAGHRRHLINSLLVIEWQARPDLLQVRHPLPGPADTGHDLSSCRHAMHTQGLLAMRHGCWTRQDSKEDAAGLASSHPFPAKRKRSTHTG